jgi:predicted alpha/beta superfamily hydrolase
VLLLIGAALAAAAVTTPLMVIPRGQAHFPPRASNGTSYVLYVHAPAACTRANPCPALYVLDGERWLTTVRRITEQEARNGTTKPVILVGIGYRDILRTATRRKLDFTPPFNRKGPGAATGGADAYLAVLQHDLIPYAETRFPIDRSYRGLMGHSYGGLFAIHALGRAPDLFQAYLIVSPAAWFDGYKIFNAAPETSGLRRCVVLAADRPKRGVSAMVRDVARLAKRIAEPNWLSAVQMHTFPGATHTSVVAPAVRMGLPVLFSSERAELGANRARRNAHCSADA